MSRSESIVAGDLAQALYRVGSRNAAATLLLQTRWRSSDSRYAVTHLELPGVGHFPQREAPDAIADILVPFFTAGGA